MPCRQAIARATVNAARTFQVFRDRGTLNVGAVADIALLELRDGTFDFLDNYGNKIPGRQRRFPSGTCLAEVDPASLIAGPCGYPAAWTPPSWRGSSSAGSDSDHVVAGVIPLPFDSDAIQSTPSRRRGMNWRVHVLAIAVPLTVAATFSLAANNATVSRWSAPTTTTAPQCPPGMSTGVLLISQTDTLSKTTTKSDADLRKRRRLL